MIELSNIIGFIGLTALLVGLEWFVYKDGKRTLMVVPIAMVFSGVLTLVWNIL